MEFTQAMSKVESLAQTGAETTAEAEVDAEAGAESQMIMKLMKPFMDPMMNLFMSVIFHEPYLVNLGGKKEGLDVVYEDFKPEFTAVTTHKKPSMYNFGNKYEFGEKGGMAGVPKMPF